MLLNADQLMIRDMARNFAREHLLPFAAERDRHHEFPAVALGKWVRWVCWVCWCRWSGTAPRVVASVICRLGQ